jgi:photosystem II stability/assembly factor-like uncharacterized protein
MSRNNWRVLGGAAACGLVFLAAISAGGNSNVVAQAPTSVGLDPALLATYQWRSIGPDRGGRSLAVAGVKGQPNIGYFGATGGGLWKTTDRGETWAPVTDQQIGSASVGAVAVAESNPDIVFIGTGESCIRGNIMPGDGVYKSTDAGKSWKHIGFRDAQNISKIRIHPTNADIVYVAAFGQHGVSNDERGIFKSTNGGATWRRVLFRNGQTAGIDLSIDRQNPNVIYAALWEAFRKEYTMSSGGPGSGLFKSTDGGETWTEITKNAGMPAGVIGRIGVSVSPADSNRVYALVENENGGLLSSDNGGTSWTMVNQNRNIRQRAFYYTHVAADPKAKDTVYLLNVNAYKSTDGGKTLGGWGGTHGDYHDVWIDPDDPQHVMLADDGGGAVSTTGGVAAGGGGGGRGGGAWSAQDFPTAQYYHVITTKHLPYHVCGAQQDGSTVCVSSEPAPAAGGAGRGGGGGGGGRGGGAAPATPYSPGGAEPAYIAPDPKDPDVFFSGGNNGSFLVYTNRRTGQSREAHPYPRMFSGEPASAIPERVQWTFPIVFSPVDPNILYTATQHVWKTTNAGLDWVRISEDLTRHDPKTLGHSGGPITGDMNGPEIYATVFALAPSKVDVNVLWAGSDDGVISVTRDGGKSWLNVTPKEMPEFGRVSIIDASAFDAGTAYAAVKRPLLGDHAPYLFRTHDFGKSWTKIVNGLKPNDYTHSIREDQKRRNLLYAGTQHGMYYSYDDGGTWHSLSLNLPDVPISDIWVEDSDLVISTHGRSFYVLDDIGPLRQFNAQFGSTADVFLFAPEDAIRSYRPAQIKYFVKKPAQSVTLEIVDPKGTVVRTFRGGGAAAAATPDPARGGGAGAGGGRGGGGGGAGGRGGGAGGGLGVPMNAGFNTVTWDLRYDPATSFPGMVLWGGNVQGPLGAPGTYQVKLTADGRTQTQPMRVRRNPLHRDVTDADLQAQFDLAIQIRDKTSEANNAVIQIRNLKSQIADRLGKSQDPALKKAGDGLTSALSETEEQIYQVRNQSGQDPLNFPIKVNNRLASLLSIVNRGDTRPSSNVPAIFKGLVADLKVHTDALAKITGSGVPAFNKELTRLGLEPVK